MKLGRFTLYHQTNHLDLGWWNISIRIRNHTFGFHAIPKVMWKKMKELRREQRNDKKKV